MTSAGCGDRASSNASAHTFRYQLTEQGSRLVLFRATLFARILGGGLAQLDPYRVPNRLQTVRRTYEPWIKRLIADARLAP